MGEWDHMGPVGCLGPLSRQFQDLRLQGHCKRRVWVHVQVPQMLPPREGAGLEKGQSRHLLRL